MAAMTVTRSAATTVGLPRGHGVRADWQTNYQHTRSNDDDDEFGGDDTQKNGSGVAIMPGGRYRH